MDINLQRKCSRRNCKESANTFICKISDGRHETGGLIRMLSKKKDDMMGNRKETNSTKNTQPFCAK